MDTMQLRTLHGTTLKGADGEKIGRISDVYEPARDGGSWFATVHTGIFGTGSSFVPLDKATETDRGLSVPYSKDFVKGAPHIADDAEISQAEELQIFSYYGIQGSVVVAPPLEPASESLSPVQPPLPGVPPLAGTPVEPAVADPVDEPAVAQGAVAQDAGAQDGFGASSELPAELPAEPATASGTTGIAGLRKRLDEDAT